MKAKLWRFSVEAMRDNIPYLGAKMCLFFTINFGFTLVSASRTVASQLVWDYLKFGPGWTLGIFSR